MLTPKPHDRYARRARKPILEGLGYDDILFSGRGRGRLADRRPERRRGRHDALVPASIGRLRLDYFVTMT